MAIEVANRQRLCSIDSDRFARLAQAALEAIGRAGADLTIAFVRDRRIRALNRAYRGKDSATDVLSFPSGDEQSEGPTLELDAQAAIYLGDVVISTDTALRQAKEATHSFEREASELIIHGTLHLCGYDHETDNGEMNRLELKLRRRLLDRDRRPEGGKR